MFPRSFASIFDQIDLGPADNRPILVDTGDGIFTIAEVRETDHEVFIFLGPMP